MKKLLIYAFTILIAASASCNSAGYIKNIGIPFIVNHNRQTYSASTQNWSIAQTDKGFLYFGNNDGILEFDGRGWQVFHLPNNSVVRSLLSIGDTIFAGGFEEIGYLAPSSAGSMVYHSLNHLIPEEYKNFDEVWSIYQSDNTIIFQTFLYIFSYRDGTIQITKPENTFSLMHQSGDILFVVDRDIGLMHFEKGRLQLLSDHPIFFRNEIRSVLEISRNQFLIATSNDGIFTWDGETLNPWDTEVNDYLKDHMPFTALKLTNGNIAWGSLSNGLFIANQRGEIIQHMNRLKGLQNNTILSLFEDKRNNLWLGLDNGIDFIEISSPLSYLDFNYNIETAYASILFHDILYVGTNQGLYALERDNIDNIRDEIPKFRLIKGTEGQVWNLTEIDGRLFCGHNFGCFEIDGFSARKISDIRGFWNFARSPYTDDDIIAGTYSGFVRLNKVNDEWAFAKQISGFRESSRCIHFDQHNYLWMSHGYRGLFKLRFSHNADSIITVRLFKGNHGLPDTLPYNIQIIVNDMFVTTHDGIFQYDYNNQRFYKPEDLNNLFKDKGFIDKIHEDKQGNLWYFTQDYLGVMRLLEDGTYSDITSPFSGINDNLLPAFQNINTSNNNDVWIGSWSGLIHYNTNLIKDFKYVEEVFVTETLFYDSQDTINLKNLDHSFNNIREAPYEVPYRQNSVSFRFTIPSFENPDKVRFSHRLRGFSDQWSEWSPVEFKEFTNLKEGDYIFEIKALNSFGNESGIKSIRFSVSPPFHRSNLAYAFYAIMFAGFIATNIYIVRRRMLRIKLKEKLKNEQQLAMQEEAFRKKSVLSEKEIFQLKNESLQNDMNHKNRELANATLHLIQKNKTLTSLRNELNKLLKSNSIDHSQTHLLSNFIKKINRDLRNEKNRELFDSYFDEVHQDFIARLKEKYEDLTPKELRLCAYLKMNISTKEIAPLMDISVRGVEISRYRLRKKLNLKKNDNLTDFIMSF